MRKILIIENQYTQFKMIQDYLFKEHEYEIIPRNDEYVEFTDIVRVWVNGQYDKDYQNLAFKKFLEYLSGVDLIIMDHILGGAHLCLTGIDLANKINHSYKKVLPVLFLSRSEETDEKRLLGDEDEDKIGYEIYESTFPKSSVWVHKGFFGKKLLEKDYFKKHVLGKIRKLLGDSEEEKIKKILNDFILNKSFTNIDEYIEIKGMLISILNSLKNENYFQKLSIKFKAHIIELNESSNDIWVFRIDKEIIKNQYYDSI